MPLPRKRPIARRVQGTQPAAQAQFTVRNDSGGLWVVRTLIFTLVTDGNVAARDVTVIVSAAEDVWFATTTPAGQAAGQTVRYVAYRGGIPHQLTGGHRSLGWPTDGLIMPPGHVLASDATSLQVGDQFSLIHLDVVEYPETLPTNWVPSPFLYEDSESE